jgi:hypothetical protein
MLKCDAFLAVRWFLIYFTDELQLQRVKWNTLAVEARLTSLIPILWWKLPIVFCCLFNDIVSNSEKVQAIWYTQISGFRSIPVFKLLAASIITDFYYYYYYYYCYFTFRSIVTVESNPRPRLLRQLTDNQCVLWNGCCYNSTHMVVSPIIIRNSKEL